MTKLSLYRGTIAYDDDDLARYSGRDPVKRRAWYEAYWKTEKYRTYHREWIKRKRAMIKLNGACNGKDPRN